MRPLEVLMLLLCLPATLFMLTGRRVWPFWLRLLTICAVLVTGLHAWLEGAHWQLIPAYLAVLLLLVLVVRPERLSGRAAGVVALGLVLAACGLATALPMFHLPKPTGPYPIGTRTQYFIDPNRQETHEHSRPGNREVVIQTWYPSATASGKHAVYRRWRETDFRSSYQYVLRVDALQDATFAPGRFPVIIFNHAWHGFRNRSTFLAQELASQGFMVVGISHPWNAAVVELHDGYVADGRDGFDLGDFYKSKPISLEQRVGRALDELKIQVADDRFILDQLQRLDDDPSSPYAGHLDLTDVGTFGHSFGGAASVETAKEDPRVRSALELDGAIYGQPSTQGPPKPELLIEETGWTHFTTADEHSSNLGTSVHAVMYRMAQEAIAASLKRNGGYEVIVQGIDHENFTDKGFFSPFKFLSGIGEMSQKRAAEIIDQTAVAFFLQTLKGQPQPLLQGDTHTLPEIKIKTYPIPDSPSTSAAAAH